LAISIKRAMRTIGLILRTKAWSIEAVSKKALTSVPGISGRNSTVESKISGLLTCRRPLATALGVKALSGAQAVGLRRTAAIAKGKRAALGTITRDTKGPGRCGKDRQTHCQRCNQNCPTHSFRLQQTHHDYQTAKTPHIAKLFIIDMGAVGFRLAAWSLGPTQSPLGSISRNSSGKTFTAVSAPPDAILEQIGQKSALRLNWDGSVALRRLVRSGAIAQRAMAAHC
jgi:hypothetical protein